MTISEEKESPQKKIEKLENIVKECEQKLSEEIRDEGERELENTKLSALHDLEYLYEESQLARDIDRKVFEAGNNKQWRREYMSYQVELDRQFKNGKEVN